MKKKYFLIYLLCSFWWQLSPLFGQMVGTPYMIPATPVVASLNCSGYTLSPSTIRANVAYSGTMSIPYTGANGLPYLAGTAIACTGDFTGLTATLQAGTLSNGSGTLTYTLSGTPSGIGGGSAYFAIDFGQQSCVVQMIIYPDIPANITLGNYGAKIFASVYDNDYLPYTAPTVVATLDNQRDSPTPSGVNPGAGTETLVNVQGVLSTTGVTLTIPIGASGSGTLPAYAQTITIPAAMTQDGISRNINLSWSTTSYTSSSATLTATLKSLVGDLNLKQLDINTGIGSDYLGYLIGQFSYPYNNAANTYALQVRDIAGIPDRNIGVQSTQGGSLGYYQNNLYVPVASTTTGKIWLNNNLGAYYSNINNADFNPTQQATSTTDYKAYGSLYQWGRYSDGHELISYSSGSAGTGVNDPVSTTQATNPSNAGTNKFIAGGATGDWVTPQTGSLWQGVNGTNNPCPYGFRVPTAAEWQAEIPTGTSVATAFASSLKLSFAPNRRYSDAIFSFNSTITQYTSSTATPGSASGSTNDGFQPMTIVTTATYASTTYRGAAMPCRCIKN